MRHSQSQFEISGFGDQLRLLAWRPSWANGRPTGGGWMRASGARRRPRLAAGHHFDNADVYGTAGRTHLARVLGDGRAR